MRIVFVNGCFDILHPGHIHFLREARKRGDKLIVGLNIDDSIFKIKGKIPYYSTEDRKTMLEALSFVDLVVPFGQANACFLLEVFHPHVYVTGSEHKGAPEIRAAMDLGAKVFYIDRLGEYASSKIKADLNA